MSLGTPILQFGTSRFLQAHADLFVSEAMETGAALGPIAMVQTTASPDSAARIRALAERRQFPVRVRGVEQGRTVDRTTLVRSVVRALDVRHDVEAVRRIAVHQAQVMLSNTGDRGFLVDAAGAGFPALLLSLLRERWMVRPDAPLTVLPCELLPRNGAQLRDVVCGLAVDAGFCEYLRSHVVWGNSLVDRIVSEPILPIGAVAEPYALWAIEAQPGLVLPCRHASIVLTDDLAPFEHRKLHLLNLGHTMLAEHWLRSHGDADRTVGHAMADPGMRAMLEAVWADEVLPVFEAEGDGPVAHAYRDAVRERFMNPFLAHRLSDIAQNHAEKKQRRLAPILRDGLRQPALRAALAS